MFIFEGNEIETDSEGYLKETTQWNEAMAEVIAGQEGITLPLNTGKWCALCANFIWSSTPRPPFAC
jgi:sulfur relay (sulfurtransferase) DsrC/TusE family protein